jgi:sulfur carrier protein
MITITANGKPAELDRSMTVAEYLDSIGFGGRRVAVAVDGEMIPSEQHGATVISDGSRVEIVRPVGGG